MIFDYDVEGEDFIEIVLNEKELEKVSDKGINKDFINPFSERILNVYIRTEK